MLDCIRASIFAVKIKKQPLLTVFSKACTESACTYSIEMCFVKNINHLTTLSTRKKIAFADPQKSHSRQRSEHHYTSNKLSQTVIMCV